MGNRIWEETHTHSGENTTIKKLTSRYYFKGISDWARKKVQECVGCSHKNNISWTAEVPPLKPIPVTPKIMARVHLDTISFLKQKSKSGNKHVILAVDAFTKYVEAEGSYFQADPIFFLQQIFQHPSIMVTT